MPNNSDAVARADQAFPEIRLPAFITPAAGPVVIAIEGPNGAGKTTLSWALSRKLGIPWCLGTDEAWFSDQLKIRMIRDADWFASAMFFLSGCFEQSRLLRTRADPLMIMDRCLWSTLAVHAATDPNRLQVLLEMLNPIARNIEVPQITLVLKASFETCQSRIANKTGTARALDELTASKDFHAREHAFYRWLGARLPSVLFLETDQINPAQAEEQAAALLKPALARITRS